MNTNKTLPNINEAFELETYESVGVVYENVYGQDSKWSTHYSIRESSDTEKPICRLIQFPYIKKAPPYNYHILEGFITDDGMKHHLKESGFRARPATARELIRFYNQFSHNPSMVTVHAQGTEKSYCPAPFELYFHTPVIKKGRLGYEVVYIPRRGHTVPHWSLKDLYLFVEL